MRAHQTPDALMVDRAAQRFADLRRHPPPARSALDAYAARVESARPAADRRARFDGARPRAAFSPLRETDSNSHIIVVE
jgi:hypothetical protein